MTRIYLDVPYAEKDSAKKSGARWDSSQKAWYVPAHWERSRFQRWIPKETIYGIRAASYVIAQTTTGCWKCGAITNVFGFILPYGGESFEPYEEDGAEAWVGFNVPLLVSYVSSMAPAVEARMKSQTHNYRLNKSYKADCTYWMNHCEHCGMKQGDFELFNEPGGAFHPIDLAAASRLTLHRFHERFACNGTYGSNYLLEDVLSQS